MAIINGVNIVGFGKKYKICGVSVWSETKQKIIKPYRGLYCLYDINGNRVKLTLADINRKNRYENLKNFTCFLVSFFCLVFSLYIYKMLKFPDSL